MAIERMFCAPVVCCVQPSAYIDVITLSGADVSATAFLDRPADDVLGRGRALGDAVVEDEAAALAELERIVGAVGDGEDE